jgi:hypothetical protein
LVLRSCHCLFVTPSCMSSLENWLLCTVVTIRKIMFEKMNINLSHTDNHFYNETLLEHEARTA